MTKEDFLQHNLGLHNWNPEMPIELIKKAMSGYAQQECIELINFLMEDERLMEDEGDANSVYQFFLQSKQI